MYKSPVRRLLAACAVGATLALATGCGVLSSPPVHTAPAANATVAATPASSSDAGLPSTTACMLGANGADVEVAIGDPTDSCASWISNLAGDGLVWFDIPAMATPGSGGQADSETMGVACDLSDGGTQELLVEDAGGMSYGDSICSQEEQNGWTPQTGPMAQQVNAAQASAAAQAQAQAQASASASLQAQTVSDDQELNSDVATLKSDMATYAKDLGTAQSDYQSVSAEPKCNPDGSSNQNTYDDAQNVYDDGQTVYDDESSLTNDISSAQGAVNSLNSDLAQMGGTQAGTPAANDIAIAQSMIAKAQADVSADQSSKIQTEATDLQTKIDGCTG